MEKKSNLLKKILAGTPLVFGLLFNPIALPAQDKLPSYSPDIKIILKDPRTDSESNTYLKQTGVNILGEAIDYFGKRAEVKINSKVGQGFLRGLETLILGKMSADLEGASHEFGHYRETEARGAKGIKVHIKSPFDITGRNYVSVDSFGEEISLNPLEDKSIKSVLAMTQAGPNQSLSNALESFKKYSLGKEKIYQTVNRLVEQFSQTAYLFTNFSEGEGHDYEKMQRFMNLRDQNVSRNQMKINNLILTILSADNWIGAYSLLEFIKNGQREFDPTKFNLGKDIKIGLPYFSQFFTPQGEYATLTNFVWFGKTPLEFSISSDLSFTQKKADLDTLRMGGKVYDLETGISRTKISPYGYINFSRKSLDYKGFSIGSEAKIRLMKTLSIIGKLEYNQEDLVESKTRGKGEGFYGYTGFELKF